MRLLAALVLLICSAAGTRFAAAAPLFSSNEPLELRIRGDVSALNRDIGDARRWHAARLTHARIDYEVRLRTRGNTRRKICRFPPLMLDFRNTKAGVLVGTLFEGQNRLKLVTQCKRPRRSATDLREEYLAYRVFNTVTDASFRVRLINVTWDDSADLAKPGASRTAPAFLIESTEGLGERLGAGLPLETVTKGLQLDAAHANLVAAFQYVIGNTDYSLVGRMRGRECCHNAKVFDVSGRLLSVPYDFDYSGLVDAGYAGPNPIVNQANVRQRHYLGACTERPVLDGSLDRLAAVRSDLAALAKESGLEAGQSRRALRYLEGPLAQSPQELATRLMRTCRK